MDATDPSERSDEIAQKGIVRVPGTARDRALDSADPCLFKLFLARRPIDVGFYFLAQVPGGCSGNTSYERNTLKLVKNERKTCLLSRKLLLLADARGCGAGAIHHLLSAIYGLPITSWSLGEPTALSLSINLLNSFSRIICWK